MRSRRDSNFPAHIRPMPENNKRNCGKKWTNGRNGVEVYKCLLILSGDLVLNSIDMPKRKATAAVAAVAKTKKSKAESPAYTKWLFKSEPGKLIEV